MSNYPDAVQAVQQGAVPTAWRHAVAADLQPLADDTQTPYALAIGIDPEAWPDVETLVSGVAVNDETAKWYAAVPDAEELSVLNPPYFGLELIFGAPIDSSLKISWSLLGRDDFVQVLVLAQAGRVILCRAADKALDPRRKFSVELPQLGKWCQRLVKSGAIDMG